MINNLVFFEFIEVTDEPAMEECEECSGSGRMTCGECGGSSYVDCNECSGNGTIECEDCDGKGEDNGEECSYCNGEGDLDCDYCTDGQQQCDLCSGSGDVDCYECDGSGEIEKEGEVNYYQIFGCSWDKKFIDKSLLDIGTTNPFSTVSSPFDKKFLILDREIKSAEFFPDTEEGWYCLASDDNPKMEFGSSFRVQKLKKSKQFKNNLNNFIVS